MIEGIYGFLIDNKAAQYGGWVIFFVSFLIYWTQINLSLAIAVERYILIVLATEADTLLSKSRRRKLYLLFITWIIIQLSLFYSYLILADKTEVRLNSLNTKKNRY